MSFLAYALPVVPGQSERAKRFAEELKPRQATYEGLNKKATVRRHLAWLQQTPMGDLLITVFEADDPRRLLRPFTDSEYDRWWLAYLKDVHSIDVSKGMPSLPELVFTWEKKAAPRAAARKAKAARKVGTRRKVPRAPRRAKARRKATRRRRS